MMWLSMLSKYRPSWIPVAAQNRQRHPMVVGPYGFIHPHDTVLQVASIAMRDGMPRQREVFYFSRNNVVKSQYLDGTMIWKWYICAILAIYTGWYIYIYIYMHINYTCIYVYIFTHVYWLEDLRRLVHLCELVKRVLWPLPKWYSRNRNMRSLS